MALGFSISVDTKSLEAKLRRMGDGAARAVDYTIRDMARRGPTIVARNSAEVYNIARTRLNPRNKKARGHVSVTGGLTDLAFTYEGPSLPVRDFKKALRPSSFRGRGARYVINAEYVRGRPSIIGHYMPPGSEGGRYGAQSPRMFIPRRSKYGPVQRVGRDGWAGGNFGPSVPQMVMNRGNDERTIEELGDLMERRLMNQLRRFGVV